MPDFIKTDEFEEEINLTDLAKKVWRRKLIVLLISFLCTLSGVIYVSHIAVEKYSASAIFGFQENQAKSFSLSALGDLAALGGLQSNSGAGDLLTQIKGKDFLRDIVSKLKLHEDEEFFSPPTEPSRWSFNWVKLKIKKFLGLGKKEWPTDEALIIDVATDNLRQENLSITKIKNGGYKITIKSKSPIKAALIANTIASNFLELRLENKVSKSDKALKYISTKLGEARAEMEIALGNVEKFSVENNIISNAELNELAKNLRNAREKISKLNSNKRDLEKYQTFFTETNPTASTLANKLDSLYKIAPRTSPRSLALKSKQDRNLSKELTLATMKLASEIERISNSLEVTIRSVEKLEAQARKNSASVRNLEILKREAVIRRGAYEALVAQFESQSITDGFQEALGEIYETALPPNVISSPNRKLIVILSCFGGIFLGMGLALLREAFTTTVMDSYQVQKILRSLKIVELSKSFSKTSTLRGILSLRKETPKETEDFLKLRPIANKIESFFDNQKGANIKVVIAHLGTINATLMSIALANLIAESGQKINVIDLSSRSKKTSLALKKALKIYQNDNMSSVVINSHLKFFESSHEKKDVLDNIDESIEEKDAPKKTNLLTLIIVDLVESNRHSLKQIYQSDLYVLVGSAGSLTKKSLTLTYEALKKASEKIISFVFVKS